jgi:hypothetical protein
MYERCSIPSPEAGRKPFGKRIQIPGSRNPSKPEIPPILWVSFSRDITAYYETNSLSQAAALSGYIQRPKCRVFSTAEKALTAIKKMGPPIGSPD